MIILDFSHIVNISEEIEKFWKLGRTKVNSYCLMKTPAHTVLADEIKLVRQITDEEILEVQDDTL